MLKIRVKSMKQVDGGGAVLEGFSMPLVGDMCAGHQQIFVGVVSFRLVILFIGWRPRMQPSPQQATFIAANQSIVA